MRPAPHEPTAPVPTAPTPAGGPGQPEVVCVGETMAMVTPVQAEPLEVASEFALHSGGAESNVAMYLAGLGHRVSWVSRLGDDPLGRRVLRNVSGAGVATTNVELDAAAPTGVYFKDPGPLGTRVFYYRRGSAASFMGPKTVEFLAASPPRVVHTSGITPALSFSCDNMTSALFDMFVGTQTLLSLDVNYRSALWPSPGAAGARLEGLALQAGVVFVGLDEARTLWGTTTPQQVRDRLKEAPVVVVKDGAVGATAFDAESETFVPSLPVEVNEPVGAGDAFAAGWLSGFLRGLPQAGRLRLGHLLASAALSSTADHASPPPPQLLQAALEADDAAWAGGPAAWGTGSCG